MINYIVGKDIEFKGIARVFNLKKGKEVVEHDKVLRLNNEPICYLSSDNSKEYFARNDDENGLQRFELSHAIVDKLKEIVNTYNENVDNILHSFTEDTTEEEKINALANLENTVEKAYNKIKVVIPNALTNDTLNYHFFNANIEQLESILRVL